LQAAAGEEALERAWVDVRAAVVACGSAARERAMKATAIVLADEQWLLPSCGRVCVSRRDGPGAHHGSCIVTSRITRITPERLYPERPPEGPHEAHSGCCQSPWRRRRRRAVRVASRCASRCSCVSLGLAWAKTRSVRDCWGARLVEAGEEEEAGAGAERRVRLLVVRGALGPCESRGTAVRTELHGAYECACQAFFAGTACCREVREAHLPRQRACKASLDGESGRRS
jgi:hypothetical protein